MAEPAKIVDLMEALRASLGIEQQSPGWSGPAVAPVSGRLPTQGATAATTDGAGPAVVTSFPPGRTMPTAPQRGSETAATHATGRPHTGGTLDGSGGASVHPGDGAPAPKGPGTDTAAAASGPVASGTIMGSAAAPKGAVGTPTGPCVAEPTHDTTAGGGGLIASVAGPACSLSSGEKEAPAPNNCPHCEGYDCARHCACGAALERVEVESSGSEPGDCFVESFDVCPQCEPQSSSRAFTPPPFTEDDIAF